MKKRILSGFLVLFAFAALSAQNQDFEVLDLDGNAYEDGKTYVYDVHETDQAPNDDAKLYFVFYNPTDNPIHIFGQIVEMTNTNGDFGQFCIIDACYGHLEEGSLYPATGGVIQAGEFNGNLGSNYFTNLDPTSPVEYKFRIFQADMDTKEEIPNTSFIMTYRYDEDGQLSLNDVQSISIAEVYPTVAKGFTQVNLKESAKVQIVNMQGKVVKSTQLNSGTSQLSLAGLTPGVYMVSFNGESGMTTTVRMVVK